MAQSQPSPDEIQNLHAVIDSTLPDRLRGLLKDLTVASPSTYAFVQRELVVQPGARKRARPEDKNARDESSTLEHDSDSSGEESDASVGRQRFEVCEQCDEEYDVLNNPKKSCTWHEGETEVNDDDDFWADHDEITHGTIDTDEMREEFPEGFKGIAATSQVTHLDVGQPGTTRTARRGSRHDAVKTSFPALGHLSLAKSRPNRSNLVAFGRRQAY